MSNLRLVVDNTDNKIETDEITYTVYTTNALDGGELLLSVKIADHLPIRQAIKRLYEIMNDIEEGN